MKEFLLLLNVVFCSLVFGQQESVWMHPNKGQWDSQIEYRVDLSMGKMYIEKDGFTFSLYEHPKSHNHSDSEYAEDEVPEILKAHAVKTKFLGSSWNGERTENSVSEFYSNYFLGIDQSKWKSNVKSFAQTELVDFYPGINLELDGRNGGFKYSFHVQPTINPSIIEMDVQGADKVYIDANGNLHIRTSLGEIQELKPIAWTENRGEKTAVEVEFKWENGRLTYHFPNGYDVNSKLIIDPSLIFSSFTGSTTDNWGMTATPGPNGEMYGGGISFGIGYPTTPGAYDVSYNGGLANNNIPGFDVAITKFNSAGNQLLFSTYFGGGANELPESMITNDAGDLFILGITGSNNFPMGPNPYDNAFSGGPNVIGSSSLVFNGCDIYVAKFNATGTALLASTYLGGTGTDGMNTSSLAYNYGDAFRGEIIIDATDNVYLASHSTSGDFPVTNGTTLGGSQSAVVSKLSSDLSSLTWSTYFGGSGVETGNSIDLTTSNELFVVGATTSSGLPFTGVDQTYSGSSSDGYLLKLNASNGSVISGTYMGDPGYDQTYFVRVDIDDEVYVYGQSTNAWAITPGCYGNPNSGQFLRKYTNGLNTVLWTTMIGAGTGNVEISPTAFMISQCDDIFLTGWGGQVNLSSQATSSTSNGFPTTPGAYQTTTNGSNFYLGILSANAASLTYGTFMGGTASSSNHVDGGTSRFDESGTVYHAVCAACGGNDNGFTTTPGAWSTTNPSPNCNMAVFKFELGLPYSIGPDETICQGESYQLTSSGGINFTWTPATGLNNPNIANPIASPTVTTVYYVEMDFNGGCFIEDSIVVEVINAPTISLPNTAQLCFGDSTQITASTNGSSFSWSPITNLLNPTSSTVTVWPTSSQYYYCTVANDCFTTVDSVFVTVHPLPDIIVTDDTTICSGDDALLTAFGSMQHTWTVDPTLTVINNTQAQVTPNAPTYYYATGTSIHGCQNMDSVFVDFFPIPALSITPDTSVCLNESAQLYVSGATSYIWSPSATLSNPFISNPVAFPLIPTEYNVTGTYAQGCTVTADVQVDIISVPIPNLPDSIFACTGVPKQIVASGADSYSWSPPDYLDVTSGPVVNTTVTEDITYIVTFTNVCGSVQEDIVVVTINPDIEAFNDTIVCPGNSANLWATGALTYTWSPLSGIISSAGQSISVSPSQSTMYYVVGADEFGCLASDSVFVDLFPAPFIEASPDQYLFFGESAQLSATTSTPGVITWSPSSYLSCVNCSNPISTPPADFEYMVSYTDNNGCSDADYVSIFFDALIWVPNTFTPDADEFNPVFKVIGGNIKTMELQIYNRWGELISTLSSLDDHWDGTYQGKLCQDGTYTWKLTYKTTRDEVFLLTGHVNLIR